MIEIVLVLSIPFMAFVSRMHGGGKPKLPLGLDPFILAAPYFIFWPILGYWTILCYAIAILGLRLGHGRGFHYDREEFELGSEPEKVEYLIPDWLDVKSQKILIMFLTGLCVTIGFAVALMIGGHILSGIILAISGAAKSLAYAVKKTEAAEYLRGSFLSVGLVLAYLVL